MPILPSIRLQSSLTKQLVEAGRPFEQKGSLQIAFKTDIEKSLPANIIMILDCSGSMSGRPMELLNVGIDSVAKNLRPEDRLSIVAFGSEAKILVQEKSKSQLLLGIPTLETLGSTNYVGGLKKSLEIISNSQVTQLLIGDQVHTVAKTVLFMSDGHPDGGHLGENQVKEFAKNGYTFHTLGLGTNINPDTLLMMAEYSFGHFNTALDENQLEEKLNELLHFSQNIAYSIPSLEIDVLPGVELNEIKLAVPSQDLLDKAQPGTNVVKLPDIQTDQTMDILFNVKVDTPGNVGEIQDLIEWSMAGAVSETTKVNWVDSDAVLLARPNARPTVLHDFSKALDAFRLGDQKTIIKLTTKLSNMKNIPLANQATTVLTEVKEKGDVGRAKLLEILSNTKTSKRDI
jgi:Ca-activated chloride channel family protein